MNNLRSKLIRLAYRKPQLRRELLPLIKTAAGEEFKTQEAFQRARRDKDFQESFVSYWSSYTGVPVEGVRAYLMSMVNATKDIDKAFGVLLSQSYKGKFKDGVLGWVYANADEIIREKGQYKNTFVGMYFPSEVEVPSNLDDVIARAYNLREVYGEDEDGDPIVVEVVCKPRVRGLPEFSFETDGITDEDVYDALGPGDKATLIIELGLTKDPEWFDAEHLAFRLEAGGENWLGQWVWQYNNHVFVGTFPS